MNIIVHPNEHAAARALAADLAARLAAKPRLVLGLPTGRTPIHLYRELVALAARGGIDFAQATTFNLDEFAGLAPDRPGSYRRFMERHLFAHVNLSRGRIHFLRGNAPDLADECERYERAIAAAGGIDLQILGIGTNGHIGFNEPADGLAARTHRVVLTPETRRANAALFGGHTDHVPVEALSMGMATILHARHIIMLATGPSKARCVERMVHGPVTPRLPASFLQLHPRVDVVLDAAAGERVNRP